MPAQFTLKEGDLVPDSPYRLEKWLGEGAFGQVWKAVNPETQRRYALKFCLNERAIRTLKNEAKHLTRIQNDLGTVEGFVRLHDFFHNAKYPFVAYEYVEAEDFGKYLKKRFKKKSLSPFEAAEVIYALASIMARIHTLDDALVHRDLKPSNVLVLNSGPPWQFKVADFGLGVLAIDDERAAELTLTDLGPEMAGAGTGCYMSFEQAHPDHVGDFGRPSDDVHALGVIWYELLTGPLENTCVPWRWAIQHQDHYPPWPWPPSFIPKVFPWSDFHEALLQKGLTEREATLLASCLKRRSSRPKDAGELAEKIRRLYPPLREEARKDAAEVERQRRTGSDWLAHLRRTAEKRFETWDQGAAHAIPEALWLKGLCLEHGVCTEPDADAAGNLFTEADEKNCLNARYDGLLIFLETGLFWDRWVALCSLQRLAASGHAEAAFLLGETLSKGRGADALALVPHVQDNTEKFEYGTKIIEHSAECPPEFRTCGLAFKGDRIGLGVVDEESGEFVPDDVLPIDLFRSLPGGVLGLDDREGSLGDLLDCEYSEEEMLADDFRRNEVRAKFASLWLDPWALVHQKGREFFFKAANLGHAEAQLRAAILCKRDTPQAAEWFRRAAERGNWEGRWQAQLRLASRLFDFYKAHDKEEGFACFLDQAIAWCERAKSGTDQLTWFKTDGDGLLDRMWRCRTGRRS